MDRITTNIRTPGVMLHLSRSGAADKNISEFDENQARAASGAARGAVVGDRCRVIGVAVMTLACALTSHSCAMAQNISFGPADTSSPRATFKSFIDSCNDIYRRTRKNRYLDRTSPHLRPLAERVLDCLDTSELPEYEKEEYAAEVAVCLKEIMDRVELPSTEEIPDTDLLSELANPRHTDHDRQSRKRTTQA